MTNFNAILTLERQHNGADLADEVHGSALDVYHVVTGADERGRAQIIITITAENLAQATITTRAVLAQFPDQARLEVMTTKEFDRADTPIPDLVSVTEAAQRLGVSRQAVLSRIGYGTLPAQKVGRDYAIPTAAIRTIAAGEPLPVPVACAGGVCGWCKQCRGVIAFAQDVRDVAALGGGSAVLRSPEPADPRCTPPGVLVKGDPGIREAIAAAEAAGFSVEVHMTETEAQLTITPNTSRAAKIEQLANAARSGRGSGLVSQSIDQLDTPETMAALREHGHKMITIQESTASTKEVTDHLGSGDRSHS